MVGSSANRVRRILGCPRETHSLETTVASGDGWEFGETAADDDALHPVAAAVHAARKQALAALLRSLPRRQRKVIFLRYGLNGDEPRSFREIGEILGMSHERARQLVVEAMSDLEGRKDIEHLRALLD